MKRRHDLALPVCAVLAVPSARAANAMDPELQRRAKRAVAGGLHYLRGQQAADGSVFKNVGITALALRAFLESPENYNESDGAFITRQVDFLLANVKSDGSISASLQSTAYNTAVALNALAATKNPKYDAVIAAARKFLIHHQVDAAVGLVQ
jgi:squalene cyclase